MEKTEKQAIFQLAAFMATTFGLTTDAAIQTAENDRAIIEARIKEYPPSCLSACSTLTLCKLVSTETGSLAPVRIEILIRISQDRKAIIREISRIM